MGHRNRSLDEQLQFTYKNFKCRASIFNHMGMVWARREEGNFSYWSFVEGDRLPKMVHDAVLTYFKNEIDMPIQDYLDKMFGDT
jgi:hypothetical protein